MSAEEERAAVVPRPLASRYWHHPDICSHNYVHEYPTASTTTGYCRGCGAMILDGEHLKEKPDA